MQLIRVDGIAALQLAAKNDHLEITKLLHAYGAQPKRIDCDGRAAIHYAIRGSYFDFSEFLSKRASNEIPHDEDSDNL